MKSLHVFFCSLLLLAFTDIQAKTYSYYLYTSDYASAPAFSRTNGLLYYKGTDQQMKAVFDRYQIFKFEQAFPDFAGSSAILNVFIVETTSDGLIAELLQKFPGSFLSFDDLTDKHVEPLYYPNDYGSTSPVPNLGANVSRKDLDYLGFPKAWDISKGNSSIVIGIADSSLDATSPDLAGKLAFVTGWNGQTTLYSHGTNVAALAAARGNNGSGSVGACMDCSILAAQDGFGITSQVAFTNLYKLASQGARVINMSWHNGWGHKNYMVGYRQVEQDIINYLVAQYDVTFVAAAGNFPSFSTPESFISTNFGYGTPANGIPASDYGIIYVYPASYDNVISVGSVSYKNPMVLPLSNTQPTYCCTSPLFPIHTQLEDAMSTSVDATDPYNPVALIRNGYNLDPYNSQGLQNNHTTNSLLDIVSTGYSVFAYSGYLTGGANYSSGTSYSAPIVAGTAGLMLSVNPCLKSNEIENILKLTAKDIEQTSLNQNFFGLIGAGKLEAGNAVEFVNEMKKTDGNAVIKNHVFYRFDFNLKRFNNRLTLENATFKEKANVHFEARYQIHLKPGTSLKPSGEAQIALKINASIDVCTSAARTGMLAEESRTEIFSGRSVLYPNPNNGQFSLSFTNIPEVRKETIHIDVFDVNGRIMNSQDMAGADDDMLTISINMPGLARGIYFARVMCGNYSHTHKFIIE